MKMLAAIQYDLINADPFSQFVELIRCRGVEPIWNERCEQGLCIFCEWERGGEGREEREREWGEKGERERRVGMAMRWTGKSGSEETYQQGGWWFCFAK